jgi:hypothetical protein
MLVALGSTAGTILQKRLFQRLFVPGTATARGGAGARGAVIMLDVSSVVELLSGTPTDLVSLGRGFSLGAWARESGLQAQALASRLERAIAVRGELQVLVATALVEKEHDLWNRSALYQDTFRTLARQGFPQPLIAEAVHCSRDGPSFLERFGRVVYTCINDARYMGNQGVNEARSLLRALAHFQVPPESMIVKLTGRYTFVDRSFFQLLERNMAAADAVLSAAAHKDLLFTGCFAMRAALLRQALLHSDWNAATHHGVHLEFLVLHNVRKSCEAAAGRRSGPGCGAAGCTCRLLYVARLGVAARRSDSADAVIW